MVANLVHSTLLFLFGSVITISRPPGLVHSQTLAKAASRILKQPTVRRLITVYSVHEHDEHYTRFQGSVVSSEGWCSVKTEPVLDFAQVVQSHNHKHIQ